MQFGSDPVMRNGRHMPSIHAIIQSGNLYMFTMHNPVRFADPSGLFAIDPALAGICPTKIMEFAKKGYKYIDLVNKWIHNSRPYQFAANQANKFADSVKNWANQVFSRGGTPQNAFTLSKNSIQHVSKHIVSTFSRQVPHLSDIQLELKLSGTSFFNPALTHAQVINLVEKGINMLKNQGITTGEHIITVAGERIFIAIDKNGVFQTAYGFFELTPAFFGR